MADGASRRPCHCLPVEFFEIGARRSETWQERGVEKQAQAQTARVGAHEDSRAGGHSRSGSGDPRAASGVFRVVRRAGAASVGNRATARRERVTRGQASDSHRSRLPGRHLTAASGFMSLLSHLLGVRDRGHRAARRSARQLARSAQDRPLSSLPRRRIRSGAVITLQL